MAAAGHDVSFIARGAHLNAIRRDGLRIESVLGNLHLKEINVTDDPKQVGQVDIVLFAVKAWDIELAGEQPRPLIGSNTRVIALQNGVDRPIIENVLSSFFTCRIVASRAPRNANTVAPKTIAIMCTRTRTGIDKRPTPVRCVLGMNVPHIANKADACVLMKQFGSMHFDQYIEVHILSNPVSSPDGYPGGVRNQPSAIAT